MKPKPTVSVVIPALNEEKNLPSLLTKLVAQQVSSFTLADIRVVSDGSTDRTASVAKDFSPRVSVSDYRSRRGKAYRLNQVFRLLKSDYLVVVDADQILDSEDMLENLIREFIKDPRVGLVCGHVKAFPAPTPVSQAAHFGFRVWDRARDGLGRAGIRYRVDGGLIAYAREFARELRFPIGQGYLDDDSYSYFAAKEQECRVAFAPGAVSYQKLPANLRDYLTQMTRYLSAPSLALQYFSPELLEASETMTPARKLRALSSEFFRSPLTGSAYVFLQLLAKLYAIASPPTYYWQTAGTTK